MDVRVKTVEAKTYQAVEEVVGTVHAKLKATIAARVSGRIEKLLVVPGQQVKAGDLLVQIDAQELQARLDQAVAVLRQAEIELKRITSLFDQGTLARAELDRAEMNQKVAVANAKAVETMLDYAKVTAPFDGAVTRKIADIGDLATPGQPLLEMEDPSRLRLEADVPEALIGKVNLRDKLPVHIAALTNRLEGTVDEMEPVADPQSRTFNVKLDLPQTPGLRSGSFGRVGIPVSETTTLRIPRRALVVRGQMEIVFVIDGQQAQLRLVKTGKTFGDEIEVLSGIAAGEQVVVENANQLKDTQPLAIK